MSLKWIRKVRYEEDQTHINLPKPLAEHFKESNVEKVEIRYNGSEIIIVPA